MADVGPIVSWTADHLNIIGWPVLLGFVWTFKGAFDKYLNDIQDVKDKASLAAARTEQIQRDLATVQTNHVVHLAQDVKEIHDIYDRHTELLTSIDRGIAVLVDRGKSPKE